MDIILESQAATTASTTHPHNPFIVSTSNKDCTAPKDTVVDQKVDDIEISQNDDSQIESQNQSHQAAVVIVNIATTQIKNNNNPFFSAFKGCSKWLLIIALVASALLAVGSSCLPILLMEASINAVLKTAAVLVYTDSHAFVTNTLFCYAAFGALSINFWFYWWTVIGEAQSARMRDQLYQKATLEQGESFDHKVNMIRTTEVDLERHFRYLTLIQDATGVKVSH